MQLKRARPMNLKNVELAWDRYQINGPFKRLVCLYLTSSYLAKGRAQTSKLGVGLYT